MLTIYDISGNKRFETPINVGSKRVFKLMGDDYVTLNFNIRTPINFRLGDYCDIPGFGRFELCTPYKPTFSNATGGYNYELKLEAQHIKWRNKVMRYLPLIGGSECAWDLTATAFTHLEQVLANIRALAYNGDVLTNRNYLYNGITDYEIFVDDSVDASAKTINYNNTKILDALTSIAEAFECEWWIDDNTICLGKCESTNDYIDLEIGKNVIDMPHTNSKEDYVTRLLVFGGDRNVSPRYRKDLIFDVTSTSNGGNRISDTTRPVNCDWFNANLRVSSTLDFKTIGFHQTGSTTASSSGSGDILLHTESFHVSNVSAGEWKLALAAFKPLMTFSNRTGSVSECKFVVTLYGTMANGKTFAENFSDKPYIYALGPAIQPSFQDQIINVASDIATLTISLSYYVIMSGGGSINVSYSPGSGNVVKLENSDPSYKVVGLVIDKIDASGNTVATYNGAELNPDFSESIAGRNVIQLPSGATMAVGDRFRIANIIQGRVKSSYFVSKYAALSQNSDVIMNGIVPNRLMLPISYGKPYVDYTEGLTMQEGVENMVVFDEIYPKAECHVTSVETVDRKESVENDDGTKTDKTFTAFLIKDDFFTSARPFDNEYILPNHTLQISFKDGRRYKDGDELPPGKRVGDLVNPDSGKLNGWTFEVQFKKDTDGSAIWEIVRDNNSYIPNEIIRPEINDTFVITGFDVSAVNDLMVDAAEEELLKTAQLYIKKMNTDPTTYDCTISTAALKGGLVLTLGKRVNLINPGCIESTIVDGRVWGRKSRIIGYNIPLDKPFDRPVYTVGEKAAYSHFGEIEDKLKEMTLSGKSSEGGNGGRNFYVIKTDDSTPASDTNVYSALRAKKEHLSRTGNDTAYGIIRFLKGLLVGNGSYGISDDATATLKALIADALQTSDFVSGELGSGFAVYKNGDSTRMEVDELLVRRIATFLKLEIRELAYVAGNIVLSNAASEISEVTEVRDDDDNLVGWKCKWVADDGTTATTNTWMAGDQARCQTFNIADGVYENVSNRFYWRLVTEAGTDYVILSASDHDDSTDNDNISCVPKAGDKIVQMGYRLGYNATQQDPTDNANKDRTSLIELSTNGEDAPSIKAFYGVVDYNLTPNKRVFLISPKGVVFNSDYFQWSSGGVTFPQRIYMGDWYDGVHANYFEEYTWQNCSWLCVNADGTDDEPSLDSPDWKLIAGDPDTLIRRMRFQNEYGEYDTMIDFGDTVHFWAIIEDGKRNIRNDEYTGWTITRHNGDDPDTAACDSVWNATKANISNDGDFYLTWGATDDDLQAERATFIVEAQHKSNPAKTVKGTFQI